MCLAAAVQAGSVAAIKEEEMAAAYDRNNHGAGFAYHTGGKVRMQKGFFSFTEFWNAFNATRITNPDSPYLIHFRLRTHGATNKENTHPFKFKGGMFIHNGVFSGLGDRDLSDTAHLAKIMHDLPARGIPAFFRSLEERTGTYNKLAALDNTGKLHFMNEKQGHWVGGVWYSNYTYMPRSTAFSQASSRWAEEGMYGD